MLRKHLILAILLLLCSGLFGQDRSRLDSAIIKLKAEGIDTFVVYNTFSVREISLTKPIDCIVNPDDVFYLYYISKGSVSVVKIDNCYAYLPIVNLASDFVKLFIANYKKVEKELIRPLTYIEPSNKKKKDKDRLNIYRFYSGFEMIEFQTPLDTIKKIYDTYDLLPMYNKDLPNESYKYNSNTLTVKLANLAATETRGFSFMLKEKP